MTDPEKQDAIDQLRSYERRFTEILDLVGDKTRLHGEEKARAQRLLKDLKAALDRDCKDLYRRREELNHYQRACLEPALRHAKAEIMVRTNTIPGGKWHSNLYGARINITHMLHQLEK